VAGKSAWKSQKRSGQFHGINTMQAAHLSDLEGAVAELSGDASCHWLPVLLAEFF